MKFSFQDMFHLDKLILLNLHQGRDEELSLSACVLTRSRDKITVSEINSGLKNITHFAKHYVVGLPLIINFLGKGILQKEVAGHITSALEAFNFALPNSKAEDFYIQWLPGDSPKITMIRCETVNRHMIELSSIGFVVVALTLNLEESLLKKVGVDLLLGLDSLQVEQAGLARNLEQIHAKAKLKGIGLLTIALLFLVLLVNLFCYTFYSEKVNMFEQQQSVSTDRVGRYQMIESTIRKRTALITTAGWAGGYPLAWLTDKVMASKPTSIGMSKFIINPLKADNTGGRLETPENRKILIYGNTDDAGELNAWLHVLKTMSWVSNCELVSYNYNRESSKGEFLLSLNIMEAK